MISITPSKPRDGDLCRLFARAFLITGVLANAAADELPSKLQGAPPPGAPQELTSEQLLSPEMAFPMAARRRPDGKVEVRVDIQPGYYLYRERIRFDWGQTFGGSPAKAQLPPGKEVDDATFGRVWVWESTVTIGVEGKAGAHQNAVELQVISQGCAAVGVCFPPQRLRFELGAASAGTHPWVPAKPVAGNVGMRSLSSPLPQAGTSFSKSLSK